MFEVLLELFGLVLEILAEAWFEFLAEAVGALVWRVLLESLESPNPVAGGAGYLILGAVTGGLSLLVSHIRWCTPPGFMG